MVDSPALGPTAREEELRFWQLGVHIPSLSATTCVYKVMGAPKIL